MLKLNLNRHFMISVFLLVWNGLFHSLTLSILIYWSHTSDRVPEMGRMSTLNQFWTENQILFAALSGVVSVIFLKDQLRPLLNRFKEGLRVFGIQFLKGCFFATLLILGLTLSHHYDFLGFTAQMNLNFLTSYAWILRSALILIFVLSTESLIRVALAQNLLYQGFTQLGIYWIWFNPSPRELISLALLFLMFPSFWTASGFIAGLFIFSHAIFGLPFFENEFTGILQFKSVATDESFLQNSYLMATLLMLVMVFRGSRYFVLKSKERNPELHE